MLPSAPQAARIPHTIEVHGDRIEDPYFWLRGKTNPAVIAHLKAENRYTDRVMKPTRPLQEKLFKELRGHLKETDLSVPFFHDGYHYYTRVEKGKQYAIHCRKRGTLEAPEEVILDLNRLARGRKFLSVGEMSVSDDGQLLAYTTDVTGFREYTLEVKDLRTGALLPLRVEHVADVLWAADNRTLFYTLEDEAKRPHQVVRAAAAHPGERTVVFTEPDERFSVDVSRSRSKEWIFLHIESHTTSETRVLKASDPAGAWRLVAPREQDHEYSLDHHGEWFYIRSNQSGRDFALFRAPVSDPSRGRWEPVVPHRPGVMLEGVDFFDRFYILSELEGATPHLRFTDLATGESHRLALPEQASSVHLHANPEFHTERVRYVYESLRSPAAVFEYDWRSRQATLLKQTEVPGGFDPASYESERIEAAAPDGKRVPISIIRRKGTRLDGTAPMLLVGYGSYGIPSTAHFSIQRLPLLDRGVIVGIAHIRGGGDLGKTWHDDGRMGRKRNTFTDFIACAEHLIRSRYTSADRLAIKGGSAGGLLIGATLNLRPDLFKAAILDVPFVDVINTMLDES
ncbi:MAG TPA: oligopeptidase B, partial [Verrucomicrobiales bacterium]|nr:oligopeptidase B [Verrucomicrobiales bacterium]